MNFKELLDKYEMTAYKLSQQTGIAQTSFSSYVLGKSKPINMPLANAHKIAATFGITIDELYNLLSEDQHE